MTTEAETSKTDTPAANEAAQPAAQITENAASNEADAEDDAQDAKPDELTLLKSRARMMGIPFSNNIGVEALKEKINSKMSEGLKKDDEPEEEEEQKEETAQPDVNDQGTKGSPELNPLEGDQAGQSPARTLSKRERIVREAMKLVRVRITNLDPKKKDLQGEIITVANKYIGTVKKFIPFGAATDGGYHIPKVLYDELESRRFTHIQSTRNKQTGQIDVRTSEAKEYAIEVLPPLTREELAKLAAVQASANS